MKQQGAGSGDVARELAKNRQAISKLAQSGEAKRLMELLDRSGGVKQAAQAAAQGDPAQLMAMMEQLMSTREGAKLVESISGQAKQVGLE